MTQARKLYPLFLDLSDQPVLVVGAGAVAYRKVTQLLECGAKITVVAPEACEEIQQLAQSKALVWQRGVFEDEHIGNALIVFCATNSPTVNNQAHRAAKAANRIVNVVDVPELCNAIVPSSLSRGPLQIAVTTGGAAPSLARNIRKDLEAAYPAFWAEYTTTLGQVRALVKARVQGPAALRTPLFEALTSSKLDARFEAGERPNAEDLYAEIVLPLIQKEAGQ